MSKKTILNEATIRRFMKLADLRPLAETFVAENEVEEGELNTEEAHEDAEEIDAVMADDADESPEDLAQKVAVAVAAALEDALDSRG